VIIPLGDDKATCGHEMARVDSHRCPDCKGTMRRCCASVIGFPHRDSCQAVTDHLRSKR
jgi:hypothetical protein